MSAVGRPLSRKKLPTRRKIRSNSSNEINHKYPASTSPIATFNKTFAKDNNYCAIMHDRVDDPVVVIDASGFNRFYSRTAIEESYINDKKCPISRVELMKDENGALKCIPATWLLDVEKGQIPTIKAEELSDKLFEYCSEAIDELKKSTTMNQAQIDELGDFVSRETVMQKAKKLERSDPMEAAALYKALLRISKKEDENTELYLRLGDLYLQNSSENLYEDLIASKNYFKKAGKKEAFLEGLNKKLEGLNKSNR